MITHLNSNVTAGFQNTTELLKDTKLEYFAALEFIKTTNRYFIGVIPAIPYSRNPSSIRVALSKRLLQIQTWCQPRGIKVCALLPETDLDFYAGLFNLAGVSTWSMLSQDRVSNEILTDHYFLAVGPSQQLPVFNACSCVFIIQPTELAEDDELVSNLENENTVIFSVPDQGEIKFIDEGTPIDVLQGYKKAREQKQRRAKHNPYDTVPEYDETLVRRVPLNFYEDMANNIPTHDEPRVQVFSTLDSTGSHSSFDGSKSK